MQNCGAQTHSTATATVHRNTSIYYLFHFVLHIYWRDCSSHSRRPSAIRPPSGLRSLRRSSCPRRCGQPPDGKHWLIVATETAFISCTITPERLKYQAGAVPPQVGELLIRLSRNSPAWPLPTAIKITFNRDLILRNISKSNKAKQREILSSFGMKIDCLD